MDEELVQLPWDYVEGKRGALLLTSVDGVAAGMVALREVAPNACEMRRLFVRPEFRGKGVGRRLVQRLIGRACEFGYTYMLFNTLPAMQHARKLYDDFGFYPIEAYHDDPHEGVLYGCLELTTHEIAKN
ncbi:MAG: GNAT family N-acetyltransferase [Anaerolineae bacterium]|nr:GNAT family N-acetyltransferase [Anaerolineae bacterium]